MINTAQINQSVMSNFRRLMANHRLAHAYLLVGPKDSGKTQTALALAQLVNCESQTACGECAVCQRIAQGNHPDVHVLGNDELESIKIDDIRFLLSRAHLMAYEAGTKVFIIRDIELMTMDAANALLKTLEEPAANTLMILTTSMPEINLDTIRSRCHRIPFFPSSVNRITKVLRDEGMKNEDAYFLAVYSEGCMGKIRKLMKQDILLQKHKILDEMLFNRHNDNFIKELSAHPQEIIEALQLLLGFFRDVLLFKSGVPTTELVYQDCLKELEKFSVRGFEDIAKIIRQIVQTRRLVDEKLNVKMSLGLLREYTWAS